MMERQSYVDATKRTRELAAAVDLHLGLKEAYDFVRDRDRRGLSLVPEVWELPGYVAPAEERPDPMEELRAALVRAGDLALDLDNANLAQAIHYLWQTTYMNYVATG